MLLAGEQLAFLQTGAAPADGSTLTMQIRLIELGVPGLGSPDAPPVADEPQGVVRGFPEMIEKVTKF